MYPQAPRDQVRLALAVENPVDGGAIAAFLKTRSEFEIGTQVRSFGEVESAVRSCPCDLLLLHQELPGIHDPLAAVREVRSKFPDLRILYILSGIDSAGQRDRDLADLGVEVVLRTPFSAADLISAIGRAAAAARSKGSVLPDGAGLPAGNPILPAGNVVAFYSPTGGVGTTTIAANLAASLATASDLRIALVDFNLDKPDLCLYLDLLPTEEGEKLPCLSQLIPLLEGGRLDSEVLEQYLAPTRFAANLRVLPGLLDLRQAAYVSDVHLKTLLRLLGESHHLVLVDTGCSVRDVGTYSSLRVARQIMLVGSRSGGSRFHMRRFLSLWDQLKMPRGNVRLVLSRWPAGVSPTEAEQDIGLEAMAVVPEVAGQADRAIDTGIPLVISRGPGLEEFRSAIASLAETLYPGPHGKPEQTFRLFSGFRGRKKGRVS